MSDWFQYHKIEMWTLHVFEIYWCNGHDGTISIEQTTTDWQVHMRCSTDMSTERNDTQENTRNQNVTKEHVPFIRLLA